MQWIDWISQHLLPCPYKSLTGFDCPGCGMQRSFVELLKGNIIASFRLYPGLLLVMFTIIITLLHLKYKWKRGAVIIKYSYIITISVVMVSYIAKTMS